MDDRPVLIYDGDCGFCKIWIEYWKTLTRDAVRYARSQDVAGDYPQIPRENFSRSVQLALPSGEVVAGARAVFETLALITSKRALLWSYDHVPGFAAVAEAAYRTIAANRSFFYKITVLLFGREVRPLRYDLVAWLFRKWLALVWLTAFLSFGVQSGALIGSEGVLPATQYLARVHDFLGARSLYAAPSLFWLNSSDAAIRAAWIAGAVSAVLAFFGLFWRAALFAAFLLYLSLLNTSQEFLSYQWDILLLETGFLAVFLGYSGAIVWLFRWLLFRLMFLSGAVKLLSGDPTWRSGAALLVHFQTQPIPTPLAWYAHQLPAWLLISSCFLVLAIELAISFFALGPRRMRQFALPWIVALQLLIVITGNYAFFNWLAIGLCLFLLDDAALERWIPARWRDRASRPGRRHVPVRARAKIAIGATAVIGLISVLFTLQTLRFPLLPAARALISTAAPFGIAGAYGLFATMTTTRPEIVIEGSNDGSEWREYEFRYKPGPLDRKPPWAAPHQPRLDWQMWFAALGSYNENVWFLNLLARLLQGDRVVLAQLGRNPFPEAPPKLLRARLYDYRFTDFSTRRQTGNWWTRTPLRLYVPAVSLRALSDLPVLRAAPRAR
jgi:predicted DCC family thiol-disulfide oxidoreductase YuxK